MRAVRRTVVPALLGTLLAGVLATPAQAATPGYVALGDSYASGVGSRTYFADGASCYRSPRSYPALVAADYGLQLTLAACSGATTSDVLSTQLKQLGSDPSYVTLTIGGNDVGFSSVLTECAKPGWMSNCTGAVNGAVQVMTTVLPGRLDTVLAGVRSGAPSAKVVLAGYPHLFNGEDCNAGTFFSPTEESRLNAATDRLDALLQQRATAAGVIFVSPVTAFSRHAVCDTVEYVNGLSYPTVNSYHPNTAGYRAYATLVASALLGARTPLATAAVTTRATSVRLPRVTTSAGPFAFTPPDLSSRQATRAAHRAGITRAELGRLRRAVRVGTDNDTLERLNRRIVTAAAARGRR